jgi:hypothetical protein
MIDLLMLNILIKEDLALYIKLFGWIIMKKWFLNVVVI